MLVSRRRTCRSVAPRSLDRARAARWLAVAVLVGCATPASVWGRTISWHLAAEGGPELDSNALRVNQPQTTDLAAPAAAALFRLSGSAGVKLRLFERHLVALDYGGGAKIFVMDEGRPADELVQYASAGWGLPVGASALLVSGSYYDAFLRSSTRDFRMGAAGVQLAMGRLPAGLRATFDLGYRGLAYKPLPDYGFHALAGGLGVSWRGSSGPEHALVEWELRAAYLAGLRFFAGPVISLPERCGSGSEFPCAEDAARRDLHHQLRLEARYLGSASGGLTYSLEVNRSNSYGESFVRHALGLRFTASMAWGLFLTAKATLQLSRFQDPFLISQVSTVSFASVDDENRSNLLVQLSKELSDRWAINLRWSLYVNESSTSGDAPAALLPAGGFLRHTLFLGVRFEYGS